MRIYRKKDIEKPDTRATGGDQPNNQNEALKLKPISRVKGLSEVQGVKVRDLPELLQALSRLKKETGVSRIGFTDYANMREILNATGAQIFTSDDKFADLDRTEHDDQISIDGTNEQQDFINAIMDATVGTTLGDTLSDSVTTEDSIAQYVLDLRDSKLIEQGLRLPVF
jgi:hypothetical protein